MTALAWIVLAAPAGFVAWYLWERSHRRTRPMAGGLHEDISLPHEQEWELYLNALSLCSKKARVCLAELGIEYASHHVHLIETGPYENIGRVEHGHETMTRGTEGLRAAKQASPGLRAALEPV